MKKIIFSVVLLGILVISLVEIGSLTGQAIAKESHTSLIKSTDYYIEYNSQIKNLAPENYVLCQPTDKCKGLDKYVKKFNWPQGNYWYMSFYNGSYRMEFIIVDNEIMYKHVGPGRILEVFE